MIERLRIAERASFSRWARALRDHSSVPDISALAHLWLEDVDALRKVEKDQASVRRNQKDWLPRAKVEALFTRIGTEIKTHLLALPRSLAPRLEGMSAAQKEALIQDEIYKALEALSGKAML